MPKEQATVSRRWKAAPEARGGEGIDALPGEVLQHVLSFLPVAEAVQTCVLARRWRDLWKSMPVLRITCEGRILNRRGVRRLNKFVNHLLLLRDRSAPLHACEIELSTFHSQDEPQVNLWIRHALLCQARVLSVHLGRDNNSFELLEDLPLVSLHLTRLELCNVVLNDSILYFSSCPALEELWMRGCYVQADMIMSQSLKRLTILDCIFYPNERTRISVPSLVTLELIECWGRTPLLESMPSLVTGSIKLADCDDCCGKEAGGSCVDVTCENCSSIDDDTGDCVLLNGLSEAKSLELIAEPCVFILKRDLMWCPTFSKLKTLLLNDWCMKANLGALMCFLQHTPVLEKLTIQLCQAPSSRMGTEGSYNLTGQPFVLSNKLKVLEIKCENIDERVHRILTFLSTYSIHVEQINIQQSIGSSEGTQSWTFSSANSACVALAECSVEEHG
ncbi:F-box/LRR-repeat protein At2g29910 isoform X1 [Triticum aestivum]|nr:F-box/LRR-repeat protein At2g29910-like isoform X1 [Triticum aestivum]